MAEEENKAPQPSQASQASSLYSLVKSLAGFTGDLASFSAPAFIMSPVSLSEYSQYWVGDPALFVAAASEQDPEQRMLLVLKWFINTLRGQYASRSETQGSEKKPLNPFLGELFTGKWSAAKHHTKGDIVLCSEQVSHHPPITAYGIFSEEDGVYAEGFSMFKATFSSSAISVKQYGHCLLTLKGFGESYMVTLPSLHIEGLLNLSPYIELEGKSYIQSSTGYLATLDYSGRGWVSGKKNSFKATVVKNADRKTVLYTVAGQWSGASTIKAGDGKKAAAEPFFDGSPTASPLHPIEVKPIENQTELESRRAWQKVAAAVRAADYDAISREKLNIENEQRAKRKEEEDAGTVWQQKWFKKLLLKDDPLYVDLCNQAGVVAGPSHSSSSTDKTKENPDEDYNWRFVREAYDKGGVYA